MKLKNATSNHEKQLLAVLDENVKSINFGKIILEVSVRNNKICLVEVSAIKKTLKFD
jgi:hypothetical protein